MRIYYLLFIYHLKKIIRYITWLFKLGQINNLKKLKLDFPISLSGKGKIEIGDGTHICSNSEIRINEKGLLIIGDSGFLDKGSTIVINENNYLKIGCNFLLGKNSRLNISDNWVFGNNIKIESNCSIFSREKDKFGKLKICDGTHIGDYTIIDVVDDVNIGKEVAIGPNCTLYSHDHDYKNRKLASWKGGLISAPINIEDGVWIGSNVTILSGVTIGTKAIVAAGSVVTKSIEKNSIWGGVPAKLIKRI
ncbi:acyltransferase [uncultured Polaribacter sp.]|uniref:acyltransferase n=1 Tax=uncultured Polaribacter sp. TaxID=174711 RepID=UPI0026086274|nr:acyltransferase [uncultured Polaribacter sp.]